MAWNWRRPFSMGPIEWEDEWQMKTDMTGFCRRDEHDECHGKLLSATGWHWFCACQCHPTPDVKPEHKKALDSFLKARETSDG